MYLSYDPTITPTLTIISNIHDKKSLPETIATNASNDSYDIEPYFFKVESYKELNPDFWFLLELSNGIVIDDLAIKDLCCLYKQDGIRSHRNTKEFLREVTNSDFYNSCPILVSIRGFSENFIPMLVFDEEGLLAEVVKNKFEFVVKEGDVIWYVYPDGEGYFKKVNHGDPISKVDDFLYRVKDHHSTMCPQVRYNCTIYGE